MKIVINNLKSEYQETIFFEDLDNLEENLKKFSSIRGPLEAKLFAINQSLNSYQLSKIKNNFDKINIRVLSIYSNNRHTIISGKALKIDSTFFKEQEVKNKFLFYLNKCLMNLHLFYQNHFLFLIIDKNLLTD